MKVLIIDDDPLVRHTLLRMLRLGGHEGAEAENGERGLELFRRWTPDLVVTDIIMPEQEGLGTITLIKRERPEIKVIAISGGGRVGNVDLLEAAIALGAAAVIHKPFEAEQLLEQIDIVSKPELSRRGSTSATAADPVLARRRLVERARHGI